MAVSSLPPVRGHGAILRRLRSAADAAPGGPAPPRTRYGFDRLPPHQHRPRHRHLEAYATVLLAGGFVQTGYGGRYRVEPGDVVVQPTLDRHADHMVSAGLDIIRLPWRFDAGAGGVWRGCPVDEIWRASQRDIGEAAERLRQGLGAGRRLAAAIEHSADRFFADLVHDPRLEVGAWADANGLSREGLSRGVRRLYGATPTELRGELRARAAWRLCMGSAQPLALVALEAGYADQAHMTRGLQRFTGASPAAWRRATGVGRRPSP